MAAHSPVLRLVRNFEPELAAGPSDSRRALARKSDTRTIDALYQRYAPYIAAIATRILGRESEVEDVVQAVFAVAIGGLKRREDEREAKAWLARMTVRRSIHAVRVRRLWTFFDLADDPRYETLAGPGASPEERRLVARVYRVLDTLAPRHRVPWALRYVEGRNPEEIAELCGCSLATAKRRVGQAHERISRAFAEVGDD